jgi:hypothetical protein
MLVLATASTPRPRPTEAPPGPGSRLHAFVARPRRPTAPGAAPHGWARSRFAQQFPSVMLVPSAAHTRALVCNPRKTASDCAKEGFEKGRVPLICAAGRALVPMQRGGGGARVYICKAFGSGGAQLVDMQVEPRRSAPPSTHGEPPLARTVHPGRPNTPRRSPPALSLRPEPTQCGRGTVDLHK